MREVDACACIPTRTSRVDVMSATAMHTWQQAMSRNQCMLNMGYVNLMAALCSSSLHSMQHRRDTPFNKLHGM